MAKKTFIVSDESINVYGDRVLTDGIDIADFEKNPIMLWNHTRAWSGDVNQVLPIGHWENIVRENGVVKADAVFDETDEFAKKIAKKVESGTLKACSIGIRVLENSTDPKHLIAGQTGVTITKCKLREISIVDIPGNKNAIALYDESDNIIDLSDRIINNQKSKIMEETKSKELQNAQAENVAKDARIAELEKQLKEQKATANKSYLDAAVAAGKIAEDEKEHYVKLMEADEDAVKKLISSKKTVEKAPRIKDQLSDKNKEDRSNWTYMDWLQKDNPGLLKLKNENPTEFTRLRDEISKS